MSEEVGGTSAAPRPQADVAAPATALRRCPGCHNQVTVQTPVCPVCGTHAAAARAKSAIRWAVAVGGSAGLGWWWLHH